MPPVCQQILARISNTMKELNEKIAADKNLGPGFAVGHSYFCPSNTKRTYDEEWYKSIIQTEISPLLREYWFDTVEEIPINKSVFRRVQLNRNNSFYDLLLKICALVMENLLPSEEEGKSKFRDFLREERQMQMVFEEFVRNFYRMEQSEYEVKREDVLWTAKSATTLLPKMQTDICLTSQERKIVIDTKYYKEALNRHYDAEKVRSEKLYQIFAYVKNLETKGGLNRHCDAILLYPIVARELDETVDMHGHTFRFKTLNLNQDWQGIHEDLMAMITLN